MRRTFPYAPFITRSVAFLQLRGVGVAVVGLGGHAVDATIFVVTFTGGHEVEAVTFFRADGRIHVGTRADAFFTFRTADVARLGGGGGSDGADGGQQSDDDELLHDGSPSGLCPMFFFVDWVFLPFLHNIFLYNICN